MAGGKILVVDDSPTELTLTKNFLLGKGFQIVTAVDGEEALAKAASERPDLILLDVILPKKNGFQVCRQLKTAEETREIRIVLVTSKTQDSDRFWGLKQGADGYLTKPFRGEDLLAIIAEQMQRL